MEGYGESGIGENGEDNHRGKSRGEVGSEIGKVTEMFADAPQITYEKGMKHLMDEGLVRSK